MTDALQKLLAKEGTGISWADLTFNPWIGCTKMGPACDGCYAETWDNRFNGGESHWGPGAPRRRTSNTNWMKPVRWNRIAGEAGVRLRVFCASLADWADAEVSEAWRADLAFLILATPHLDWMLLTKRFTRVGPCLFSMFGGPEKTPKNIAIGATMVTQHEANTMLHRMAETSLHFDLPLFLSMEPLLERVRLPCPGASAVREILVGGESGPTKRHMDLDWCRALLEQSREIGAAFHMKQLSEFDFPKTFEDFASFPPDLQVRERGF